MGTTYSDGGDVKAVHEAIDVVEREESKDNQVLLPDDLGIIVHDLDEVGGDVAVGKHHTLALAY